MPEHDLENLVMDQAVARQDAGLAQSGGLSATGRDAAARFFHEKATGREVPWGELVFERRAELTHSHHAQIERCRAEAADPVHLTPLHLTERSKRRLHPVAAIVVESHADQHFTQMNLVARANSFAVEERPSPSRRDVPLVADRVGDDAADRLAVVVVGD
jgi:hypothetical protein